MCSSKDAGKSNTECLNRRERCFKVKAEPLGIALSKLHHLCDIIKYALGNTAHDMWYAELVILSTIEDSEYLPHVHLSQSESS